MSIIFRLLLIPALSAVLWLSGGCGEISGLTVSLGNQYGSRRLPLNYFYRDSYYDGLRYQDYVCYDDYWYYQGYDTPYDYYWDDPYNW